jgi:hypothetical protein
LPVHSEAEIAVPEHLRQLPKDVATHALEHKAYEGQAGNRALVNTFSILACSSRKEMPSNECCHAKQRYLDMETVDGAVALGSTGNDLRDILTQRNFNAREALFVKGLTAVLGERIS